MKGWTEKGGSVQQANQAFCLCLCGGGGLSYLAREKQQLVQRKRREVGEIERKKEKKKDPYICLCFRPFARMISKKIQDFPLGATIF